MGIITLFLVNASIFSINGLGEDLSVFRTPFVDYLRMAQVKFILQPELTILGENGDYRGVFWTNPFQISLSVPLGKGFFLTFANTERFGQSFDVYLEEESLDMNVEGKGGVGEVYTGLGKDLGLGQVVIQASYLFGSSSEIWDYNIGSYYQTDTFRYRYRGHVFAAGLRINPFSLGIEGLGRITMEKSITDTAFDLPIRLTVGFDHALLGGRIKLALERSFWSNDYPGFSSANRFKIGFEKGSIYLACFYNPWYLGDVKEEGIELAWKNPISKLGSMMVNIRCSLRDRDGLREFRIVPELHFTLNEIFARRR